MDVNEDTDQNLDLALCLFVPSAYNLCKQLRPRSGRQNVEPDLDPNCLTLMVFLKCFFKKVDFEKNLQTKLMHAKLPRRQVQGGFCDKNQNQNLVLAHLV